METLALWASNASSALGLGPITGADPRSGFSFKEQPVEKKKKKKPKVHSPREVSESGPRTLRTQATLPLDIWFHVPQTLPEGEPKQVHISGPHGALLIELPPDAQPGQRIHHRLGPKFAQMAVVPEGKASGDLIMMELPGVGQIQVVVPEGKKAGDEFEASPPVLMVQVPPDARHGDTVVFTAPDGRELTAQVPAGKKALQYFDVGYTVTCSAGDAAVVTQDGCLRTECTPPVDICFQVPEILHEATRSACVLGPHGPLQLQIPEGAQAGEQVKVRLGPKDGFRAKVPEGLEAGDLMMLQTKDGSQLQLTVPEGKKEGDEFDVSPPVLMVRVPETAGPGIKVSFAAPDGTEMTAIVPGGCLPASYFEVPMVHPMVPAAAEEEQEEENEAGVQDSGEKPLSEAIEQSAPALGDESSKVQELPMPSAESPASKGSVVDFITDKENAQSPRQASPNQATSDKDSPLKETPAKSPCPSNSSIDLLTGEEPVQWIQSPSSPL
mmetsp:Transcript_16392/g.42337  ORF Transcript_16392/g.42337 Transcript_16392/m.42337 type:complete len:497 (+) Transcript_16392:67-1557(+)|eukprot:CAMPEP_0195064454 /NCGR_PEP_ID=MMETSP0448-20130528/10488_1 /TAXON_ID=66468 /ORGANISM="Heterocapsa triquestra, Strain CCMP 448" /LENGTH=496 /DNA_ID=CAMNT_0040095463 /DNA_START=61 /DNA_END=1551 /DNA_ORIENTATION=+